MSALASRTIHYACDVGGVRHAIVDADGCDMNGWAVQADGKTTLPRPDTTKRRQPLARLVERITLSAHGRRRDPLSFADGTEQHAGTDTESPLPSREAVAAAWWNRTQQFRRLLSDAKGDVRIRIGEERDVIFVQARRSGDALILEAVSNYFLPEHTRLSPDAELRLLAIGWQPPTEGTPYFSRIYEYPVDLFSVATDIAMTLSLAYGVASDDDCFVSPVPALNALNTVTRSGVAVWTHAGALVAALSDLGYPAWAVVEELEATLGAAIDQAVEESSIRNDRSELTGLDRERLRLRLAGLDNPPSFYLSESLAACFGVGGHQPLPIELLVHLGALGSEIVSGRPGPRVAVSEQNRRPGAAANLLSASDSLDLDAAWVWFLAQAIARYPELTAAARKHSNPVVRALAGAT